MTYLTNEIAKIGQVHPNTVRIYEDWGYLSPVKRASNGYRLYEDIHIFQLKIARLAFRCELIQNNLRKRATKIVQASGKQHFQEALQKAYDYLTHLQLEHQYALQSIDTVAKWLRKEKPVTSTVYSHQQVASMLGVTEEVLRNWERNGLYRVTRNHRRYRLYTEEDIQRLVVIRSLRSAHFSIASILLLVQKTEDNEPFDIKQILNQVTSDDIVHVTDQLELQLREAMTDVQELINLLETYLKKEATKK